LLKKGLIQPGKALDLCCGLGTHALYLTKKGFQVVGIDISSKAVEYAKEKATKVNAKIQFQVQSFLNLENFQDEEFDFILDIGCFHHVKVEDRDTFIYGVSRVLKNGKFYFVFCFSEKNGPAWNHFTEEEIGELLHPFGWGFLRVLPTLAGNFRFTFGCVSQIIPLWGWPVHLAFCDSNPQVSTSPHTDSSNSIVLLPSRLPTLVRNCTNPNSTGIPSSAFLSRVL